MMVSFTQGVYASLGGLLDEFGVLEPLIGDYVLDLYPVDATVIDDIVIERDGWPLYLRAKNTVGRIEDIVLEMADGKMLDIVHARWSGLDEGGQIELFCRVDALPIRLTVPQVRDMALLADEPVAMVHPMVHSRRELFPTLRRLIFGGAR